MAITQNVVAVNGTYQVNGEEKKRYMTIGSLIIKNEKNIPEAQVLQMLEDLGLSIKIESIPMGGEWNGWLSFYAKSNNNQNQGQQPQQGGQNSYGANSNNGYQQQVQQPSNYQTHQQHTQYQQPKQQPEDNLPF